MYIPQKKISFFTEKKFKKKNKEKQRQEKEKKKKKEKEERKKTKMEDNSSRGSENAKRNATKAAFASYKGPFSFVSTLEINLNSIDKMN